MVDYCIKFILSSFLPQPCLVCGSQASSQDDLALCRACLADLPVLGETCLNCANPLESRFERLEDFFTESSLLQTRYCGQCIQKRPHFDHSLVFFPYSAPFDYLIHTVKFSGKLATTRLLGLLMAQQIHNSIHALDELPDGLLAVPLHPARQRERGYNQATELARPISKELKIPLLHNLAQRIKATPAQSSLPLRERRQNLKDAFVVNYPIKNQHIAIIDDVMTSGATVNTLATKLKQAGARRVSVWCLCRAQPPS